MEIEDITKEDFEAYEVVRAKGITNMFDTIAVQNWSGILAHHSIGKEQILTIIKNYDALIEKFPGIRKGG